MHGIVFFVHDGQKRVALANNQAKRILIVDLQGKVLQELPSPKGGEFNFDIANDYYTKNKNGFVVTDVSYLDGKLYAVTGYSRGDFVLTAEMKDGKWAWSKRFTPVEVCAMV